MHARVEAALRNHPELGYQTTSELIKDLLRRWLENQDSSSPLGVHAEREHSESNERAESQE